MQLCYPENKMLPHAWLEELTVKLLYFHQTSYNVVLCVIALSLNSLIFREVFIPRCLVPHFANVKGHITATLSGWAMVHAALLHLSHFTVSALVDGFNPPENPEKSGLEINKQASGGLAVMYSTVPCAQYLQYSFPVWWQSQTSMNK